MCSLQFGRCAQTRTGARTRARARTHTHKKMRCALCWRGTQDRRFRGRHWLCGVHRKERCAALVEPHACVVTEYTLLRGLVFDFPHACERDEALARSNYVDDIWHAREKPRAVLRAHRMLGRVAVDARPLTASETLELVTEFVAFVLRHATVLTRTPREHAKLLSLCAAKVAAWYPALVSSLSASELPRAERIVRIVRRDAGSALFLVKADVVVALSNVPREIAECIYVAYVGLIATRPVHSIRLC